MLTRLQAANEYIAQQSKNTLTAAPHFHFSPPVGWINDPNGFSFYKGKYHLFYQYNPYDIIWNNIHWGHATTTDFITWEHHPVAIANDKLYDANGCFSGSAIEKDGQLYIMYTGNLDPNLLHLKDESQIKQVQCVAISKDGINFEKVLQNPVIAEQQLPDNYLICDFRDPKVWQEGNRYYCVLASRNKDRRGEILMFVSDDLLQWSFHSSILKTKYEEHTLLECPDYFQVDGKDVMLYSAMPCDPEYAEQIKHRVCYAIGKLDYELGQFIVEHEGLLDYGNSFYAPQTTEGEQQERLLIGWMQSWNQATPPEGFTFNGMMSLPRQLSIKNNRLIQYPTSLVNRYFKPLFELQDYLLKANLTTDLSASATGHLSLNVSPWNKTREQVLTINIQDNGTERIQCIVNQNNGQITLRSDYSQLSDKIISFDKNEPLQLDIFFDLYSFELFINNGEKVFTTTSYVTKGKQMSIVALEDCTISKLVIEEFINYV